MNRRRRAAWIESQHLRTVRRYQDEFARVTASTPLHAARVLPLLRELASASPDDSRSAARLYKAAALMWHPDTSTGDKQVFQLLQEAYRVAKLSGL